MSDGAFAEIKLIDYAWEHGEGEPPAGDEHFGLTVQAFIGPVGSETADSFDLIVCSPSWFAQKYSSDRWDDDWDITDELLPGGKVLPITGVWLMRSWSREDFEKALHRLFPAFNPGPDFGTVAARIARVIPWEFDYRYDDEMNRAAGLPQPQASFWNDEWRPRAEE